MALYKLQREHPTLKNSLPRFHINTAKMLRATNGKLGIIILYPLRFILLIRQIQKELIAELEKSFPDCTVTLVGQRKIVRRPTSRVKLEQVQRSRTRTAVNDAILSDLLYPAEPVARRWRIYLDGHREMKVFVDSRDRPYLEDRLSVLGELYERITRAKIRFGYMSEPKYQQIENSRGSL